jgi:hypothetical protein
MSLVIKEYYKTINIIQVGQLCIMLQGMDVLKQ